MGIFKNWKEKQAKKAAQKAIGITIDTYKKNPTHVKNHEKLVKTIEVLMEMMDFLDDNGNILTLDAFDKCTNEELIFFLDEQLNQLSKKYGESDGK